MKSKRNRLVRPGMGTYFVVMGIFCAASLVMGQYWLAAVEGLVTLGVFSLYSLDRAYRHKELQNFLQSMPETLESVSHGDSPFPAVLVRLGDGGIVWANRRFCDLTGFNDIMMEQDLADMVPDLPVDWLTEQKTEYPDDVTIGARRYRVHGTLLRANDSSGTMLGALYFVDMTKLYQIRDEYIRSRPVVSIILIDNYEELTKNLSESGISTLNAKLNDAITNWTEGYGGLLRKLERNRFLFVFEKRDLKRAIEDKFSVLEDVHAITSPSGMAASISFGLGVDAETFEEVGDICKDIASYLEPYGTPYEIIEDRAAAVEKSILTAQKGDVVILAAKGEEVYQKVRGGFEPYESDLAIAKRCLNME